ncbi:MAG: hypothetical protein HWN67_16260 [Candidatus Helarchaeota archaeon]|nr:hypothetical protein [Candidatus Helarchaeota archaeon]
MSEEEREEEDKEELEKEEVKEIEEEKITEEEEEVSTVKPGLSPKQIAILHYKLLMENNQEEWIKTLKKELRINAKDPSSSPGFWWLTGRRCVTKHKYSYTFRHEETTKENYVKFFFNRLDKDGKPAMTGQVPIHVIKDEESDGEWRIDTASY